MSGVVYAAAGTAVVLISDVLDKKEFEIKKALGGGVVVLAIAAMDNVDSTMSTRFGQLFLVSVLFIYAIPLVKSLGLVDVKANKLNTTGKTAVSR